jgi:hypothetical protein
MRSGLRAGMLIPQAHYATFRRTDASPYNQRERLTRRSRKATSTGAF